MTAPSAHGLFRAVRGAGAAARALPLFPELAGERREREKHDFYPTGEPDAIRALLAADGERIRALGSVWEPACGDGAMVREIRAAGLPCRASDLIDRGCPDSWQADFLTCLRARARAIITNPPYNLINARDGRGRWLRHTLAMPGWDYCALLLSWDWPAARANGLGEVLAAPPFPAGSCFSYAYLCRWKIDFTGGGSPPQRNAWFVWDRSWTGAEPALRFLDRPERGR